ncbi:hypothetical protein [Clostridium sp. ZS2-4]|uniref:hypothetical protein n=1 Tax=Clostridium sp. ZS2-4 TaxID=2987703 RepID=UPI002279F632|nr:hypothetical protein [Clostridium sp. ZS2-4]MCY6354738.1 hypothetical protein [Clostridium sp. ZS2-4]
MRAGASKTDDALNSLNELTDRVGYNIRKSLGMQEEYAGIGDLYVPPEKSTLFEDKVSKIITNRNTGTRGNLSQTNTQKVNDILELAENDNINKNISWKDFCEHIDRKGKYSKSAKAQAYYKHTGKMDRINDIDYGKYLEEYKPKPKANKDDRWHAHHVLYKKGIGEEQQSLVEEGARILRRTNIDPVLDLDNLVWAQNKAGQHNVTNLQEVVDRLRNAERKAIDKYGSGDIEEIEQALREELRELGKIAENR